MMEGRKLMVKGICVFGDLVVVLLLFWFWLWLVDDD